MKVDPFNLRLKVITYARGHGVRACARAFGCSRNTVRKWLRRAAADGARTALLDRSRRPYTCPHQVPADEARAIVRLREKTGAGPWRLREDWGVRRSEGAIKRIVRQARLTRVRKRKHKTKKDLRAVKRLWPPFRQLSADTKYLMDIPHYWPQMRRLKLPRFQYTVRDVATGLVFTAYADELSKTYATLLCELVCAHLAYHGVDLTHVRWQTDNGSEFLEDAQARGVPSTVRALGCDHRYIPPKAHTWQSDVETVHRWEEDEFFDRCNFASYVNFFAQVQTYWLYFNTARHNRHKEGKTPLQLLKEYAPSINPAIASWPVLDLGRTLALYSGRSYGGVGHDVPAPTCRRR